MSDTSNSLQIFVDGFFPDRSQAQRAQSHVSKCMFTPFFADNYLGHCDLQHIDLTAFFRGAWLEGVDNRGRYHGGRRPSSDDSFHSPTVIPPSALDKPSIMKGCHRRRTCSHTSPRRSPTMVTFHATRFVVCRWWNDCWTVKTVVS